VNPARILVVDDDFHIRKITFSLLEHYGYMVDLVENAEQALALLAEGAAYNLIIIDLSLPTISGWELLRQIRQNPQMMTTPCIAITAYHSPQVAQEVIVAGFSAYYAKPIRIETFIQDLQKLLS
jgi:CheY-like chemotaxis protein